MDSWRKRLVDAVDADPRSDRAISLASGTGANFVNELRNTDKEPGVNKVIRLARTLNLSLGYVFTGANLTVEDEADLALFLRLSPASRRALLGFAQQIIADEHDAKDEPGPRG